MGLVNFCFFGFFLVLFGSHVYQCLLFSSFCRSQECWEGWHVPAAVPCYPTSPPSDGTS